jgi:hypothetical protein
MASVTSDQNLITRQATKAKKLAYSEIYIGDFSGGLNIRDALTELSNNETPDCMNVILDERGACHKRLGKVKWNATKTPNPLTYGYESDVCNCILWYSQADGKLYRDDGGVLTNIASFAPDGTVSITDFAGTCYVAHSFDGLFFSGDGTNWSLVVASGGQIPSGDMLATWQNRLWIASSNSNLLSACAPGDATQWDPAKGMAANYIREGNDFPIVCLFGTSGVDVQAQPALLVGKRSGAQGSIHRVIDASNGDYVTMDQSVGPAGPSSITSLYGRLYIISTSGIFETDGQTALVPVGAKLSRLWRPDSIDFHHPERWVATRTRDRVRFSLALLGSDVNNLALEYHPGFNAFTARDDASAFYVVHGQQDGILLGTSPTVPGQIYQHDVGGADDGQPIASRLTTKVFEPTGGYQQRLQHIHVLGRGTFTVETLPNFALSGKGKTLSMQASGFTWDSDGWDDPSVGWGEDLVEGWDDFWPRQLGRAFQIRFTEESTNIGTSPPLGIGGPAQAIGAWATYGLHLTITPLHPYG